MAALEEVVSFPLIGTSSIRTTSTSCKLGEREGGWEGRKKEAVRGTPCFCALLVDNKHYIIVIFV